MKKFPVVVLLTDFGMADQYVASMKGVILSLAPRALIVDLSHSVSPQHVDQAAFLLWSAYRYFPKGSIFACVVDPGVGTSRNIICVRANGYVFLAPDNGLLKYVFASTRRPVTNAVTEQRHFLSNVSSTFHGRDIVAPVAARLHNGIDPRKLGPRVAPEFGAEEFVRVRSPGHKSVQGKVIHIDHFGNIITNVSCRKLPSHSSVTIGQRRVKRSFPTYAASTTTSPFLMTGSAGLLEIAVRGGDARASLKAQLGQRIMLHVR